MADKANKTSSVADTLLPLPKSEQTWNTWHYIALWISMDIGIPTYYLASGLLTGGMNLWQALFTILLANLIIAIPIFLNGHAGAKYGIPSPIYWRATFGFDGATIPAIIRGVIAAGWFGIQIWIGGSALNTVFCVLFSGWADLSVGIWVCFGIFWLLNMFILFKGMDFMKKFETIAAPFLVIWLVILLIWAYKNAGSWGPLVNQTGKFATFGAFMLFFIPALTSNVGYWGGMTLTVTDLTRFSKGQKSHIAGMMIGLPSGILMLATVGALVTSMTVIIFGEAIWDPVVLTGMVKSPLFVIGSMLFLMTATLTTNVAANAVTPANVISHVSNGRVNFKQAAIILGVLAIIMRPWALIGDLSIYMDAFLVGGAAFLGPIAGLCISHYYLISKTELNLSAMYNRDEEYSYTRMSRYSKIFSIAHYVVAAVLLVIAFVGPSEWMNSRCSISVSVKASMIAIAIFIALVGLLLQRSAKKGGYNPIAMVSLTISILVVFSGLWIPGMHMIYDASWFVGTILSIVLYYFMMKFMDKQYVSDKAKVGAEMKEKRAEEKAAKKAGV